MRSSLTKRPEAAPSPVATTSPTAPPLAAPDDAWELVEREVDGVPHDALVAPRVDLQTAAVAILRVVAQVQSDPALAARFRRIAEAGELDADVFAKVGRYAHAAWYARHQQGVAETAHRAATVPAEVIARAVELRDRMLRLVKYHFDRHPEEGRLVAKLNAAPGHLKLANTLCTLAELYRRHPTVVARDARHFRPTDEADARALVDALCEAQGSVAVTALALWTRRCARVWSLLSRTYAAVQPLGRWLLRDRPKAAEKLFPSLVTGSRRKAPRRNPAR